MENIQLTCPACHQSVNPEYYFCPNCGKNLKEKITPISVLTQIGIYALSILLPPLGLWPGIKYLIKGGTQAKTIGVVAIILTVISTIVTIWLIYGALQSYLGILQQAVYGF
jgi:hypothetical protein